MIGHHKYSRKWADGIKASLFEMGFADRPLHIISANMHSVKNVLYAHGALNNENNGAVDEDLYQFIEKNHKKYNTIEGYALDHGMLEIIDQSGANIDCQIIDTSQLESVPFHSGISLDTTSAKKEKPVLLVIDYAFGTQAFEVLDEILSPVHSEDEVAHLNIKSISVMGKAGILPGKKGDIMLASAHVFEGMPHNYIVNNDLSAEDFDSSIDIYTGPIVTVLGTSLQNRDVLKKFQKTSWKAIGLEMEGGHYHRAISAAIVRGHIPPDVKVRYAYYASDNPVVSGQTLASGGLGEEGIRPTYMITKVIVEKIFNDG